MNSNVPNHTTAADDRQPANKSGRKSGMQKITVAVLLLLATAVIFVLPNLVSEPWIDGSGPSQQPVAKPDSTLVSPSTAAQKTKYRQDAQTLLAEIIQRRDRLNLRRVELWGEFEYHQAQKTVEQGDQEYSYGDYGKSVASYQRALDGLRELEARGEQLLEKAIIDTGEAISNSVLSTALSASQLASAIAPDNKTVLHLVQRTATLPTVIVALQRGNQLLALQRYDQAAIAFREATLADPEHQKAAAALTSTEQQITEQRFLGHMSDGFKALDKDNFELAIAAFNRAATVYADNPAVEQALAQVETRRSQLWVSNSMAQAAEFEQQERWQKALEIYQQLLATDATLTDIKVKLIPVSVRADLDTRITKVLSDPLALSAISHYRHGQKVLQDATGIANPGPLLSQQITRLNQALKTSQTPIEVTLVSDSNTDVTLFKVARLGSFDKTAVSLKPGRYIVAGSRMGYRDVRIEFTLTDQGLDEPIAVSCTELI